MRKGVVFLQIRIKGENVSYHLTVLVNTECISDLVLG